MFNSRCTQRGKKTVGIIIFLILSTAAYAKIDKREAAAKEPTVYTVDQWLAKYSRSCAAVSENQVCKKRLDKALRRMKDSQVPSLLDEYKLPGWLATVPIVESEGYNDRVSKAGAIGLWQVMPYNIQLYYTKTRTVTVPWAYSGRPKMVKMSVTTKPTMSAAKKLGVDPKISTLVAGWLLIKSYQKYKDWRLTMMSYNAGEPRVDRYIKGKGKPLTFETANYYNQLMAIQKYIEGLR